jgi:hypothetical protein
MRQIQPASSVVPALELSAPPAEPGPPQYVARNSSSVMLSVEGSAYVSASGAEPAGSAVVLDGDAGTPAAYTIYKVAGLTGGTQAELRLRCELSAGGPLLLGLADQSRSSWEWSELPALSMALVPGIDLAGRLTSSGSLYFCIACPAGSRAVLLSADLQVGFPAGGNLGRDFLWNAERRAAVSASSLPDIALLRDVTLNTTLAFAGITLPSAGEWSAEAADALLTLGCAWQLSGDPQYLVELERWLTHVATYDDFQGGRVIAADIDAGMLLFAVCTVVEWTRPQLDPQLEARLLELIELEAEGQSELLALRTHTPFWNHAHYQALGTYAAGCVLDGHPRAAEWRDQGAALFESMEQLLDAGGGACYPEGCAYASAVYGLCALYREMRRTFTGGAPVHPWWGELDEYFAHTLRPDGLGTLRIADDEGLWFWHPSAALRHAAAQSGDGRAQALAAELRELGGLSGGDFDSFCWQELLMADPGIAADVSPRPVAYTFEDYGLAVERESWKAGAGLLAVRAGLPGGSAYNEYLGAHPECAYGGMGHLQADLASLQWWSGDACLLADPGFESRKLTAQHNALTFSGRGQMGEAAEWWGWGWDWKPWGYGASIDHFAVGPGLTVARMNADSAYVPMTQVSVHRRHVLWLKPNVLVVLDRVGLNQAREIEANWITQLGTWKPGETTGHFTSARLHCRVLGPQPAEWRAGSITVSPLSQVQRLQNMFAATAGETHIGHIFWDEGQTGWKPLSELPDRVVFSWPQKPSRLLNVGIGTSGELEVSGEVEHVEEW